MGRPLIEVGMRCSDCGPSPLAIRRRTIAPSSPLANRRRVRRRVLLPQWCDRLPTAAKPRYDNHPTAAKPQYESVPTAEKPQYYSHPTAEKPQYESVPTAAKLPHGAEPPPGVDADRLTLYCLLALERWLYKRCDLASCSSR